MKKPRTVRFRSSRRFRNYLLMPLAQIRLGAYLVGVSAMMVLGLVAVIYLKLSDVAEIILELTDVEQEVIELLIGEMTVMTWWIALVVLIYVLLSMVISVVYTHRMVGPVEALRRHIGKLAQGDYQRIKIRHSDEFSEMANEFNRLVKIMEDMSKRQSRD